MMRSIARTKTKRACDGCQVRKIKCDGNQPCQSCAKNPEIACTFLRTVHARGPRRMRQTTRNMIERTQRAHVAENTGKESAWKRTPVGTLAPQLYIYHMRMFPVWPVVNVDNLIAELQQEDQDSHEALEAYALATSIVAATVAQLRVEQERTERENIRASNMVRECEKACSLIGSRGRINLNTVRIFFFLHIYYENQHPGSGESLLRLRDSISVAQLMSLHREISYTGHTAEEQNLRRWILWLLFVTERGVCLLHKLPVIIKTSIALPSLNSHVDGLSVVLPAFVQLINLFWTFELFGLFDVIGDTAATSLDLQTMEAMHRKLHDAVKDLDSVSDVQKVDIYVTRHWMEMILWKLRSPLSLSSNDMSVGFPFNAALDFLDTVDRVPKSAIETHGLTIQLKIVEIASSVVDSISHLATLSNALPTWTNDLSPSRILTRLHVLMSSFRHNVACKSLVDLLYQKTADVHNRSYCPLSSGLLGNISDNTGDEDGETTTDQRQNSLSSASFDDWSIESILVLGSANELPYGYSNDTSSKIDSPEELPFDQRIDQDTIYTPDFSSSLHDEESVPFTLDHDMQTPEIFDLNTMNRIHLNIRPKSNDTK